MNAELDRRRMLAITAGVLVATAAFPAKAAPTIASEPAIGFIEVNGTRLAYQQYVGGGRRPLVFLHGYALRSTGRIYSKLLLQLRPHFYIYALDMRGHGGSSSSTANWSQETITDDVAAFTKALKLRDAVFVGHSLGGFTGMYAQIRHPGLFASLMLLATSPAGGGGAPQAVSDAFVKRGRDPAFARENFSGMFHRPKTSDVQRAVEAVTLVDPNVHDAFFANFFGDAEFLAAIRPDEAKFLDLDGCDFIVSAETAVANSALR